LFTHVRDGEFRFERATTHPFNSTRLFGTLFADLSPEAILSRALLGYRKREPPRGGGGLSGAPMGTSVERRRNRRAKVRWPVVMMTSKGPVVGETRNVSDQGAFICCKEDVTPEARCRLFMMVPDQKPLVVPVEVCWSNPYGSEFDATPCGVGVRFSEISAADREAIVAALTGELLEEEGD